MSNDGNVLEYLTDSINCLESLKQASSQILAIVDIIRSARENKKFVFIMGNGGSASTSSHIVCDLTKQCGIKSLSLTDNIPLVTAWSNDVGYGVLFERQVERFAKDGDVVIGISSRGTSKNIIRGMKKAKAIGCHTIGLIGFDGGILKDVVDECIIVESYDMQHVEDVHLVLGHMITLLLGRDYEN